MAKPDLRINKHGVNVADVKIGKWVEVEWNDAPPEIGLLVWIEEYQATYKGERRISYITLANGEWHKQNHAGHTQITRIVGKLKAPV
jgi:hypothetical protein